MPQSTLVNAHSNIIALGELLINAKVAKVDVAIISMGLGTKLKGKSKPRTHKQAEAEQAFKEIKLAIYHEINPELAQEHWGVGGQAHAPAAYGGVHGHGHHYSLGGTQTGTWTAAASDIMRRERAALVKARITRDAQGLGRSARAV